MTQDKRGQAGRDVFITSLQQKMPGHSDWFKFLRNGHNKTQLIGALVRYLKSAEVRRYLKYPVVITDEEKTWYVTKHDILERRSSNHVEADTRILMEAIKSDYPVVVRAADTDILILMCYAYCHEEKKSKWIMQIDSERFVSINSIINHFGPTICNILPAYQSITGSDTTSYPANIGKVRPFKKMIKSKKENLLSEFGEACIDETTLKNAMTFFQVVMYPGKEDETITETRSRMYAKQKTKSSTR